MKKIETNHEQYAFLFNDYTHSLPIIFSHLNGQYNGELYLDNGKNPKYGILITPFAFHYFCGKVFDSNDQDLIEFLNEFLKKHNEAIFFCPSNSWNEVLDKIFSDKKMIKDVRKSFSFNKSKYLEFKNNIILVSNVKLEEENISEGIKSNWNFLTAKAYVNEKCISWCSSFMIGKGHAEINLFTEEGYRHQGYATSVCVALIDELIRENIIPDWNTWPYRLESQNLAFKLGFEDPKDINTLIYIKDMQQ